MRVLAILWRDLTIISLYKVISEYAFKVVAAFARRYACIVSALEMEKRNELICFYFHLGLPQKDILSVLAVNHRIIVSLRQLQRILHNHGLFRHRNYTDIDEVVRYIAQQLNGSGKLHGYRWMYEKCTQEGLNVRKEHVRCLLAILDPRGVLDRNKRRLHRREYFSRGPNFIWHMDSYDKLKPYGICINGCVDGYSRKIIWLNAYNTSSDPLVIGGYYTEAVERFGGCPRIVRGDRGTENSCVRDFQQFLRRDGTDRFRGEKSFMYGRSTSNQRIESWWGILRKESMEFWIDLLTNLKDEGHFDGGFLDKNLVIYCFLGLIQVTTLLHSFVNNIIASSHLITRFNFIFTVNNHFHRLNTDMCDAINLFTDMLIFNNLYTC